MRISLILKTTNYFCIMPILIAPIGTHPEHVITWMQEVKGIERLWILHSKTGDFPKIAKELIDTIKSFYDTLEIKTKLISDPFGLENTMDLIDDIMDEEYKNNIELSPQDFIINVSGGTNTIAAASILAATINGTQAHYVLNKQFTKSKNLVIELPVPPIGLIKMNKVHQEVLQVIANGYFQMPRDDKKKSKKQGPGIITNEDVLKQMKWNKVISSGKRNRREGATRMSGIVRKFEKLGYIKVINHVPHVNVVNGRDVIVKATGQRMYEITPLGRRKAKSKVSLDKF